MQIQTHSLLASGMTLQMAYTQKKAERVITGLEKPINDHLLKLWTVSDSSDRDAWIEDLVNWIDEIGEIVLRPNNARPSHTFYYKLLFFESFGGGAGISNILSRLRRLHRFGFPVQIGLSTNDLLVRLQVFHRDLSGLWAGKPMRDDQIRLFLTQH
jgi:hypothetical protein